MALNEKFVERIKKDFPNDFELFLKALDESPVTSIRLNDKKIKTENRLDKVLWCEQGRYLDKRPVFTLDPLFNAGAYYVQEASSMFVEQFFNQYVEVGPTTRVLDLCASPGGKSTHIASLLGGKGLLVSNEVVKNRVSALRENLTKWGFPNVVVTNSEPQTFGKCEGFFDVILVDAPCSGEGMFRKDNQSIAEWSEFNVKMCAERQRKILTDVFPALKTGGILIYSTCTYNREEDEDNLNWICSELGGVKLTANYNSEWGIVGGNDGLHFYPYKTKGEGFFISAIRKTADNVNRSIKYKASKNNVKVPKQQLEEWVLSANDFDYSATDDGLILAYPKSSSDAINFLKQNVKVVQSGVVVALMKGRDLIPAPAFAMSTILNSSAFNVVDLDWRQAMTFLKKDNLVIQNCPKGWVLARFHDVNLGWLKNLGNRLNNAFPAEWHVRMQVDESLYSPLF